MSRRTPLLAVLLASGFTLRAAAQTAPTSVTKAPATPTETRAVVTLRGLNSGLRAQVEVLRAQLEEAQHTLAISKARYQAGQETQSEVIKAETAFKVASAQLEEAQTKLERETRLAMLERPVDVKLADASLRQAAIVIGNAAGLPVIVDDKIPVDKRFTLDAKGVSLGLILETMAQKTDLMLAPDPKGIRLEQWPVLVIDGQRSVRKSDNAPWSEDWVGYLFFGGRDGANQGPFGSGGGVLFSRGGPEEFATTVQVPAAPEGGLPPLAGVAPGAPNTFIRTYPGPLAFGGGGGPVSLAPIGDKSVVFAEPGSRPQGEVGYWLTVYKLEGDKLRKVSSTFHQSQNTSGPRAFMYGQLPYNYWAMPAPPPATALPPRKALPESNRLYRYTKPGAEPKYAPQPTPVRPPKPTQIEPKLTPPLPGLPTQPVEPPGLPAPTPKPTQSAPGATPPIGASTPTTPAAGAPAPTPTPPSSK
jgi:hypothetical protein